MHNSNIHKFIGKFCLFLIPLLLFLSTYEIIIRHIENDYSFKNNWLEANSDKVEILSMGSSYCYWGIDPACFSLEAFNAGHERQSMKYNYLIYNKFIKKMDSLKLLIITVSCGEPFLDTDNKQLIKNYALYYHFPTKHLLCNFDFIFGIHLKTIYEYVLDGTLMRQCTELGFGPHINLNNDWKQHAGNDAGHMAIGNLHAPKFQHYLKTYDENMKYLKQIAESCKDRNVKVILVSTPFHSLFRENINKDIWTMTMNFCNIITKEFDNVSYINLFEDIRFDDEDYYNAHHLNVNGASKLSSILNEYIESLVAQ